jgi:hypothetical protein
MNFQNFTKKIDLFIKGSIKDNEKRFTIMNEIFSDTQTNNKDVFWKALDKGNL